ncbi:MAG: type II secretion system F family protein [Candidatus Colwellbacteria bacterium]|nr:type II secretion system F family protein [Candidatus Colwellbacteria bacterium]
MKFRYKARSKTGELQVGFVEGADRTTAANTLMSHGLYVLSIEDAESNRWYDRLLSFFNRVKQKDLMIFSRQFATLLSAKVALNDALLTIQNQTINPTLREALVEISGDIDAGLSLSQAMEKHSDVFSIFYVNMIRSAEVTGRVEDATNYLADYIEKQAALMSKVKGALMYPIIMVVLFLIVGGIITTVVLPQIGPIFEEAGVNLPFVTRMLVASGEFLAAWWWLVVFGIAFLAFVLIDYFKTAEGKVVVDELVLRIPGVATLLKQLHVARFSESLSVLLKGAVPVAQAVEITGQTIGSAAYRDLLQETAGDIRRGELLSQSLGKYPEFFPPFVGQMVSVGEKTGRLEEMLGRVSAFYTQEVGIMVSNLVELIQPILMVVIGVLVGGLFASILIPIYNLIQTF